MSPARKRPARPVPIFQIKVTLEHIEPATWRRLLLPSNLNLGKLHHVIQEAMGWTNSHLHQFILRDRRIGDLRADDSGELEFEDEKKLKLDQLVGPGQSIRYEYDFGDGWNHEVLVEKAIEPDERIHYPICVAGARACPPEDCGGPPGYENLVDALQDTEHDEHDQLLTWVGGLFDPESFDVNAVNRRIWQLK